MWLLHLPTNKLGTVEEVADATMALLTNEWITGTIWCIDGGMMARSNMPNRPKPPAPKEPVDVSHDVIVEQP
jgi:glucose 1-dehydrogenase